MELIFLLPIAYTTIFFLTTQVLRKVLGVQLTKSKNQANKDANLIDKEITALRQEQSTMDSVSKFVEYSLLERKINKLLKEKERLFKSEDLIAERENPVIAQVKNGVRVIVENSFLMSILFYLCFRTVRIPLRMNTDMFYPLGYYLGFGSEEGEVFFSLSLLFSYLIVRFCNTLGVILLGK